MEKTNRLIDTVDVEQSENFNGAEVGGIREMTLRQLSKCILEGSKEMDKGGIETRIINGEVAEINVPNQIQIFINNVDMLWDLLLPKVEENKLMNDKLGDFEKQLKDIYITRQTKTTQLNNFIRLQNQINPSTWGDDNRERVYNDKIREIEDRAELDKLSLYQKKLKAISFLLNKLNYFDESGA